MSMIHKFPRSSLFSNSLQRHYSREFASRRPPPPSQQPHVETFASTSKPRPYPRPTLRRDFELPRNRKLWPVVLASGSVGVLGWALFLLYATNQEKLSSSVVRQILFTVRSSPELSALLGDSIHPESAWFMSGDPWISGMINQLQGNVDVSFRLVGSKGAGTLYFTSIRRSKGEPFDILRFKVIADDGTIVQVPVHAVSS